MVSTENTARFDLDMDGSMEPSEHGRWVRYEDLVQAIAAEREACARITETSPDRYHAAATIRARSNS